MCVCGRGGGRGGVEKVGEEERRRGKEGENSEREGKGCRGEGVERQARVSNV